MMNHEVAAKAIEEAREALLNGTEEGRVLFDLRQAAKELDGDDKNAVFMVINAVEQVLNCPVGVDFNKVFNQAVALMDEMLERVVVAIAESRLDEIAAETVEENKSSVDVNDWHEPTADELQEADNDAALDDAYEEAFNKLDALQWKLEDELWEYEYGGRKDDDDAEERLSELKDRLEEVKDTLADLDSVMYKYGKGWMDFWEADHVFYTKMSQF